MSVILHRTISSIMAFPLPMVCFLSPVWFEHLAPCLAHRCAVKTNWMKGSKEEGREERTEGGKEGSQFYKAACLKIHFHWFNFFIYFYYFLKSCTSNVLIAMNQVLNVLIEPQVIYNVYLLVCQHMCCKPKHDLS